MNPTLYPLTEEVSCANCGKTFMPCRSSWRKFIRSGRTRPFYCTPECSQSRQRGSRRKPDPAPRRLNRLEPVHKLDLNSPPPGYGIPEAWREVGY